MILAVPAKANYIYIRRIQSVFACMISNQATLQSRERIFLVFAMSNPNLGFVVLQYKLTEVKQHSLTLLYEPNAVSIKTDMSLVWSCRRFYSQQDYSRNKVN